MKIVILLIVFSLFPIEVVAACDWSKPQPQADCYPATAAPNVASGDVNGVPNPGAPSAAPKVTTHYPPPSVSQLYNQCAVQREEYLGQIRSCLTVLDQFNGALKACNKKRRR